MNTVGVRLLELPFYLDIEYTYMVPEHIKPPVPGEFVLVPFGRGNKSMYALVTSIGESTGEAEYKPVFGTVYPELSLNGEQLGIVSFVREHTFCPTGDAVKRVVPADAFGKAEKRYRAVPDRDRSEMDEKELELYDFLLSKKAPVPISKLEAARPDARRLIGRLTSRGDAEISLYIGASREGSYTEALVCAENLPEGQRLSEAQRRIYELVCTAGELPKKELLLSGFSAAQIKTAETKGLVFTVKREALKNHYASLPSPSPLPPLSGEQKDASDRLISLLEEDKPRAALLYGVTGSGKTRVILEVARKAVGDGGSVIILVPEIALTRQAVETYASAFGSNLAVLHSGLSPAERFDAYTRIKRGDAKVVLGTRSAVFAPCEKPALIVIDEEQEHTYKSDISPKYHARDVARFRAAYSGSLLLLSSATPSVETFYKAKKGIYELVKLTHRVSEARLPEVRIADMRDGDGTSAIGGVLASELSSAFSAGKQSMLFLNRRGYSSFLSCLDCGNVIMCPNCSVSLTYHRLRYGGALVCHYCGYTSPLPRLCPSCGGTHLSYNGCGTQQLEEEAGSLLPSARVIRMDADSTRARYSRDEAVTVFGNGEADVLIGTQMIAKGHNFPDVVCVGVIDADSALFLDDFRADEHAFSLITQVVGRAGRGKYPGLAVIQTRNPENATLKLSAKQDYDAFYENEIKLRKSLSFPPFCNIALFTFSGDSEPVVRKTASSFTSAFGVKAKEKYKDVPYVLYGPFEAPVFRVGGAYRLRLVVKHRDNSRSRAFFRELLCGFARDKSPDVTVTADIDPSSVG